MAGRRISAVRRASAPPLGHPPAWAEAHTEACAGCRSYWSSIAKNASRPDYDKRMRAEITK